MTKLGQELKEEIMRAIDLSKELTDEELLDMIDHTLQLRCREKYLGIRERLQLRRDIFNSIRRLDILQELVEDTEITEIMINGASRIFIEKAGRIEEWDRQFESERKLFDIIQQIVSGANRVINETSPIVDARLYDGSRVNIVLPPISLIGPVVTIRKFPEKPMTMEQLIAYGSISGEAAEFLKGLVAAGYNIFISGGTGAGKTTFLNALSGYIPADERVITIEDSAELQITSIPNLVRLEVRNANVEGKNAVTIRELIKSSLRMRPDRIIVGEVRDDAAIDMLQGLNTGHSGLSTGHANSAGDMLSRLETMVMLGADIPALAVRRQIASALDLIIHLGRLRDHSRRVLEITEVLDCVDGEIELNPIYVFREEGEETGGKVIGSLKRTGSSLTRVNKMVRAGGRRRETDAREEG